MSYYEIAAFFRLNMAQAPDPPSPSGDIKEDPPQPAQPAAIALPLNPKGLHPAFLPRVPKTYKEDNNSPLHIACYRGAYNEALMLLLSGWVYIHEELNINFNTY